MVDALIETDRPLLATHAALGWVPEGCVNVHGHVHNNTPPRPGPYINMCVEHTGCRPLALEDTVRLAARRLIDGTPAAETTAGELARLCANR